MTRSPVILIIFRRPDYTARVLQAIAAARPRQLFVIADGPRPDRPDDIEACRMTRALIDEIDWECDVVKHYSDENLGCGHRPATGITWALDQVGEAIVLEDDCVPHPSFFRFCDEMLERYRDDERVMHISGSNFFTTPLDTPYSYVFTQYNFSWGWATWRRAWKFHDPAVPQWGALRETSWLQDQVGHRAAANYWADKFERAYRQHGDIAYWDYQWTFACWANSGLTIIPRRNLVSNIGFGEDATNTSWEADPNARVPVAELEFPLIHPPSVMQMRDWDRRFLERVVLPHADPARPSVMRRLVSRVAPEFLKGRIRRMVNRPAAAHGVART